MKPRQTHFFICTHLHPERRPSRRAGVGGQGEGGAGRRGGYGNAVLATTDGQEQAACPAGAERAKRKAVKRRLAALQDNAHAACSCPSVE